MDTFNTLLHSFSLSLSPPLSLSSHLNQILMFLADVDCIVWVACACLFSCSS
jgi:hypothetical protein